MGSNRTLVELKSGMSSRTSSFFSCSNRTLVELK